MAAPGMGMPAGGLGPAAGGGAPAAIKACSMCRDVLGRCAIRAACKWAVLLGPRRCSALATRRAAARRSRLQGWSVHARSPPSPPSPPSSALNSETRPHATQCPLLRLLQACWWASAGVPGASASNDPSASSSVHASAAAAPGSTSRGYGRQAARSPLPAMGRSASASQITPTDAAGTDSLQEGRARCAHRTPVSLPDHAPSTFMTGEQFTESSGGHPKLTNKCFEGCAARS